MSRLYISGPISLGDSLSPDQISINKHQFFVAEEYLLTQGYSVVNPCRNEEERTWEEYMKTDIRQMLLCDGIYMLQHWEKSKGAVLEFYIAKQVGMTIDFQ